MLVRESADILRSYELCYPGRLRRAAPLPPEKSDARVEEAARTVVPEAPAQPVPVDSGEKRAYISLREQPELFTDDEKAILLATADKSLTADDLIERTQIPARRVLSALTMLQVRGYGEEGPGRRFRALVLLKD